MATKTKHPKTYRARRSLSWEGRPYGPGDELPALDGSKPETVEVGGDMFYVDQRGRLFIRDDWGRRWTLESKVGHKRAVLERPREPVSLDDLVARGLAWAPGDGPDDTTEASR